MLKHQLPSRTDSTIDPQRPHAGQHQSGTPGKRHANTGLRLIETSRRSDPRPTSGPGRPWFAIAVGLLCWLIGGLIIIQF